MKISFCGITAKRIETLNPRECYCDRCCFRDTQDDCIDTVACDLGMYWVEIPYDPTIAVVGDTAIALLLKKRPTRMSIIVYKGKRGTTYTARYKWITLGTFKTPQEAKIACLSSIKAHLIERINSTSVGPQQKGIYVYTHKEVKISKAKTLEEARVQATQNITTYYNILIKSHTLLLTGCGNSDSLETRRNKTPVKKQAKGKL